MRAWHVRQPHQRHSHFREIYPFITFRVSETRPKREINSPRRKFKMRSSFLRRISHRDIVYIGELSSVRDEVFVSLASWALCWQHSSSTEHLLANRESRC